MTKPKKLTASQEEEVIRRHKLYLRVCDWLDKNDPNALAIKFGVSKHSLYHITTAKQSRVLSDEDLRDFQRRYRHAIKVRKIKKANTLKSLERDYGISTDRIRGFVGMKKVNGKRIFGWQGTAMGRFATMALSSSPVAVAGYY